MLRRTEAGWILPEPSAKSTSYLASSEWLSETLGDIVAARLAEDPSRVAVIDGKVRMTRRTLYDSAIQLGSALTRRGLQRGSVVSFQLPNWSEACVINLACALFGFVVNPLLPMYRERDLSFILSQCRSDALFAPETFRNIDFRALIARAQYPTKSDDRIFWVRTGDGKDPTYHDLLKEDGELITPPKVEPGDVKMIVYTSGSTGRPKGVLHSHYTLHAMVRQAADFWGIDENDKLFIPSPIGHIGGSAYAFEFPWIAGAAALLMDSWSAPVAADMIETEQATFCAGATPFLQGLLASAVEKRKRLPSLTRFICGGASVPASLIERASAQFEKCIVSRAYGSSEVPLLCPGVRSQAEAVYGRATDGEVMADVRIVDSDDNDVENGMSGEILARAPQMFIGYLDASDDAGQFTEDGYFRMGDIGRFVESRFLEITGRKKDIIIRLGENISPREIENVLLSNDAISQVAIVGIPDERTGERAVAFLVLNRGCTFSIEDMKRFLAEAGIARQKFPEELHIVEILPMNSIGKVLKEELKNTLRKSEARDPRVHAFRGGPALTSQLAFAVVNGLVLRMAGFLVAAESTVVFGQETGAAKRREE